MQSLVRRRVSMQQQLLPACSFPVSSLLRPPAAAAASPWVATTRLALSLEMDAALGAAARGRMLPVSGIATSLKPRRCPTRPKYSIWGYPTPTIPSNGLKVGKDFLDSAAASCDGLSSRGDQSGLRGAALREFSALLLDKDAKRYVNI